jgi:lipopolysaccharide export system permease protein
MLMPFILIISSKESSKYSKLQYITFLIGLFFIIFSETTIRLITNDLFKNSIIASVPIIILILLYFIFFNKFYFKDRVK